MRILDTATRETLFESVDAARAPGPDQGGSNLIIVLRNGENFQVLTEDFDGDEEISVESDSDAPTTNIVFVRCEKR